MRKLSTRDIFRFSRMLKAGGILEPLKELITEGHKRKIEVDELGQQIIFLILDAAALNEFEDALYGFLSPIIGKEPEEIANQALDISVNELMLILKDVGINRFFTQ